ncbi:MAG: RelA/SpoT family protein [Rikenellaceae bacterium]|jgi:GTP pyrophosphokinase|nr:RelA/SpoT family protein [Rikenellaceae bacterium]
MDRVLSENTRARYAGFLAKCAAAYSPKSVAMISDALALADEKLEWLVRYNDQPLLDHSVGVAKIVVAEIGLGRNSVISTLLHDVVRLGMMTAEEVGALYGTACTDIINGMTSISGIQANLSDEQAENIRELIISYSTDPRVILIKLADRLEVMRTLDIFPGEKREKKSWESLNLYAKIAHKLGLYAIKSELEDLSLKYLQPADYNHITEKLSEGAAERKRFIDKFLVPIEEKLQKAGIKYHVKGRTKSIYSIWTKMRKQKVDIDEIFDIFAIRIIIDCPREDEKPVSWNVYSIVTDFYQPNPARLRDWITHPKSNGYESLHTTVVTGEGKWVEIQIRSERMDEVAERGIAAHWRYKGVVQGGMSSEEWLSRLRELIESTDTTTVSTKNFDANLSTNEILVFTPTGDLRKLPSGATVLDFAFHIHTNVGATCTGGRVNGRNVSIKHTLANGDIVQILTSKNQKPKADWLNIVHTTRARNKIRAYMREEEARAATLGREELERKIKNWKLAIAIDDAVSLLCKHYKVRTGTELYGQIAAAKIDVGEVKEVLARYLSGESDEERRSAAAVAHPKTAPAKAEGDTDALVIDDRIKNIDYKFAKCCNPIFGDDVFGFVTRSAGITIHRNDCPNAGRMRVLYPYRVMEVRWRDSAGQGAFRATIRVTADDQTGIVNRITDVINQDLKLNIRSVNFSTAGEVLSGVINVEVPNRAIVDTMIYKILEIKGVQKAYRVNVN